jgi:hypothetical protein
LPDDDAYSETLAELDSIANAAMTQYEREMRARPVLSSRPGSASPTSVPLSRAQL